MVLYIIGLGLADPQDISLKGLAAVRASKEVYLEYYTSVLLADQAQLEKFYGRPIVLADRDFCEVEIDQLLDRIALDPTSDYSFLVVGDPFGATTHSDLFLRAVTRKIQVKVVYNAGIIGVVGRTGLQAYRFGEVVSIPLFTENWRPYSFLGKIEANLKSGLHTLCLLDIKVKERTQENILKDKKIYQPPRFMTVAEAASQILEAAAQLKCELIGPESKCIALARLGSSTECIKSGTLATIQGVQLGGPLHSLVVCGKQLHSLEKQMFEYWSPE